MFVTVDGVSDWLNMTSFCMICLSNSAFPLKGYSSFCNCNAWNSLLGTRLIDDR